MKYTIESFEEKFGISPSSMVRCLEYFKHNPPIDTDFGICWNLSKLISNLNEGLYFKGYDIVKVFSEGWKHHTGVIENPIPYEEDSYFWKGQQLEYRLDLINYIIEQLKEIK